MNSPWRKDGSSPLATPSELISVVMPRINIAPFFVEQRGNYKQARYLQQELAEKEQIFERFINLGALSTKLVLEWYSEVDVLVSVEETYHTGRIYTSFYTDREFVKTLSSVHIVADDDTYINSVFRPIRFATENEIVELDQLLDRSEPVFER